MFLVMQIPYPFTDVYNITVVLIFILQKTIQNLNDVFLMTDNITFSTPV